MVNWGFLVHRNPFQIILIHARAFHGSKNKEVHHREAVDKEKARTKAEEKLLINDDAKIGVKIKVDGTTPKGKVSA